MDNLNYKGSVCKNNTSLTRLFEECFQRQIDPYNLNFHYRPSGKESTEIQISQYKGKESENSYQKNFSGKSLHFPFPYIVLNFHYYYSCFLCIFIL